METTLNRYIEVHMSRPAPEPGVQMYLRVDQIVSYSEMDQTAENAQQYPLGRSVVVTLQGRAYVLDDDVSAVHRQLQGDA